MNQDLLKGLSDEQIARVKACKNQEEILKLAQEEGIELSSEQLEAVSGGCETTFKKYSEVPDSVCPLCGTPTSGRVCDGYYKYFCFNHSPTHDWLVKIQ